MFKHKLNLNKIFQLPHAKDFPAALTKIKNHLNIEIIR